MHVSGFQNKIYKLCVIYMMHVVIMYCSTKVYTAVLNVFSDVRITLVVVKRKSHLVAMELRH